jgi:hypothetical protein
LPTCPNCSNPVETATDKFCSRCSAPVAAAPTDAEGGPDTKGPPALHNYQSGWDRQSGKRKASIIFLVAAGLFSLYGLIEISSDANVVGGDAYNYIISAGRGTRRICVGILCALVSVVFAIFDLTDKLK